MLDLFLIVLCNMLKTSGGQIAMMQIFEKWQNPSQISHLMKI